VCPGSSPLRQRHSEMDAVRVQHSLRGREILLCRLVASSYLSSRKQPRHANQVKRVDRGSGFGV
jgi:hypothetical protein